MRFIKIANELLKMELTPAAVKVYVYLSSIARENFAAVKVATICDRCNTGRSTVFAVLNELEARGLVQRKRRKNLEGGTIANGYTITPVAGKWFKLERPDTALCLDNRAFMVYLFYCRSARNGRAWPSLRHTAKTMRVCKSTVIRAIKFLKRLFGLLLQPIRLRMGNNVYLVSSLEQGKEKTLFVGENEQRPVPEENQYKNSAIIIHLICLFVKITPLFCQGWSIFWTAIYRLSSYSKKRKDRLSSIYDRIYERRRIWARKM